MPPPDYRSLHPVRAAPVIEDGDLAAGGRVVDVLRRREVAMLHRLAGATLEFQDIHTAGTESLPGREALLKSLHLQRGSGEMVTGLAANVAVWQHTRYGAPWLTSTAAHLPMPGSNFNPAPHPHTLNNQW